MKLISIESLWDSIPKMIHTQPRVGGKTLFNEFIKEWINNINSIPIIESRSKGKWIETIDSIGGNLTHNAYECSCCNCDLPYKTKFCPNCGTQMESEE